MTALREQRQQQAAYYRRARDLLGPETEDLDRLRGDWRGACVAFVLGEVDEAELEEREAEIEAVERRVRRYAAAVEETRQGQAGGDPGAKAQRV